MRLILFTLLVMAAAPAAAAWLRAETPGFVGYAQLSERELRQQMAQLQQFDALVRLLTGIKPAADTPRLPIYFVSGRDLPTFGFSSTNIGGFYRATAGSIAAVLATDRGGDRSGALAILFHEYTHHFMFQHTRGSYPAWYVEGFAEYLASAEFRSDRVEFGDVDEGHAYQLLALPWLPMAKLFGPQRALRASEVPAFYALSWLTVHYLSRDEGRRTALTAYLAALGKGTTPEAAFTAAFATDYKGFEMQLRLYLKGRKLTKTSLRGLPPAPDVEIRVTALPPSADTLLVPAAELASRPYRPGPDADAKADGRLLAMVRKAAARSPNDAFAARVLAEAEVKIGDAAAGATMLDTLLKATPDDPDLLMLRGGALIAAAGSDADRRRARSLLTRANRQRPDDYRILSLHAQTFSEVDMPEREVDVLRRAAELAPQVADVQIHAATVLAARGKTIEARQLLAPIANSPHGGSDAAAAAALLAKIGGPGVPVD